MKLREIPTGIVKSAILTVSMRWTDHLIGLVSTLILARLLLPTDFGIIAMASLVVGLADLFMDLGVNVALIQNRDATLGHYNTAWTLRILQSAAASLFVALSAPFAAIYFSEPRLTLVLEIMSISLFLSSLENIGIVTFQKEMRFSLDFQFAFLKRIFIFFVTVFFAWLLRSYWALVIGTLAGRTFGVFLSYQMHSMRPKLSFEKLKDIFSISQWMLLGNASNYLNVNLHKFIVGGRSSATIMGGYALANDIASMPTLHLLGPINRALFPAFVQSRGKKSEIKRLFLLAQGVQSLIAVPASIGLALVAREAVVVLLGTKWLLAVPFVQLLALANVAEAITTSGGYVLITMSKIRGAVVLSWAQAIMFAATVFLIVPEADAIWIARMRILTVFIALCLTVWLLIHTLDDVGLWEILGTISRPILGAGLMTVAVTSADGLEGLSPVAMLCVKVGIGLLVYPIAVLFMWWIVGKPAGTESYLLDKARMLRNR